MKRGTALAWARVAVVVASVALLEALCRTGIIKPLTLVPPSLMVADLYRLLADGEITDDITQTFLEVGSAFAIAGVVGFALGAVVHALPRVRQALDPLLAAWYAIPLFVFYPLLVALFGLTVLPLIAIGVGFATPAMMIATLTGLDRVPPVLRRVARIHRLSWLTTIWRVVLPSAAPYLFGGLKLSFAYAFIGVIAGEFILSGGGLGYGIAYAYESFENRKMYALMLFVLLLAVGVNAVLQGLETHIARKRSRQ